VSDCCLAPSKQFISYTLARTSYIRLNDVRFVKLHQYALLEFYSASSLKQQSASRHFAPLG